MSQRTRARARVRARLEPSSGSRRALINAEAEKGIKTNNKARTHPYCGRLYIGLYIEDRERNMKFSVCVNTHTQQWHGAEAINPRLNSQKYFFLFSFFRDVCITKTRRPCQVIDFLVPDVVKRTLYLNCYLNLIFCAPRKMKMRK